MPPPTTNHDNGDELDMVEVEVVLETLQPRAHHPSECEEEKIGKCTKQEELKKIYIQF